MTQTTLSEIELRRYKRHIMLPELGTEGQEKLKKSSVLVVGAGGLGAPVLLYLAAAGIGKIGIADNDLVSDSNLQRQVLYGAGDLGKQKAIVAKQRLQEQNPLNEYVVHNICLGSENADLIMSKYDVIVDATDNFPTRYMLDDICSQLKRPLVYGSIYKYEGQVTVFHYQDGPGLTDLYPEMPVRGEAANPSSVGILGILPGITGSIQACEVIKILTETGEVMAGKMLLINIMNSSYNLFSIVKK